MHIRRKPWARPELEACPYFYSQPKDHYGRWQETFKKTQALHLELGCGRGGFIAKLACENQAINYLAIDLIDAVLGPARRTIEAVFATKNLPVDNLKLMAWDIERIDQILSPDDQVDRIYINFCNPWPRRRQHKKRLTHPRRLSHYKDFLTPTGEIHFKTDNDQLFSDSLTYFEEAGFTIKKKIYNLHASSSFENIETEHEKMYHDQGIPIKFLIARVKKENSSLTSD